MSKALRWKMAILITAAIAISYFDRQTLPIAIKAIQREIPVTNTQFSHLQAAFLAAYALMYAGSGKLIDVLGTRRGFLLIMVWWSLACASQGLATSVPILAVSLFLLGMGEGGGFPAATKAMAEWFPARERSTAMGLMNAGTAVGAVAAPPLIALTLASELALGFLPGGRAWVAVDLMVDPGLSACSVASALEREEREELAEVLDPKATSGVQSRGSIFSGIRKFRAWSSPSFSAMLRGTSTFSGCRSIYMTCCISIRNKSATLPGFRMQRRAWGACWGDGFQAG